VRHVRCACANRSSRARPSEGSKGAVLRGPSVGRVKAPAADAGGIAKAGRPSVSRGRQAEGPAAAIGGGIGKPDRLSASRSRQADVLGSVPRAWNNCAHRCLPAPSECKFSSLHALS
jgi:hypothetical protein